MMFRGVYRDGVVVPETPVNLPEGAAVEFARVTNSRAKPGRRRSTKPSRKPKAKPLPAPGTKAYVAAILAGAGAWAHRKDIPDSASFARRLRASSARSRKGTKP